MRDLTEEELKLAPEWATHYDSDYIKAHPVKLCFFNDLQAVNVFKNGVVGEPYFNEVGISDSDRELPIRKTFDISEHEFSCESVKACKPSWVGDDLQISILDGDFTHHDAVINKQDVIAMAKALGVTAKDLS